MSIRHRIGWQGEAFVAHLLEKEGWEVFNLAPSAPVDLIALRREEPCYTVLWVEVKVKTRGRPRLTLSEAKFMEARKARGDLTRVYHLRRMPGGGFRVVQPRSNPPP